MVALLTDPDAWVALCTLMALEIILGIDNVVFISILVSRCTREQALRARQIGLSLAFVFRVALLFSLTSLMQLTYSLFSIFGVGISWRDIILIGGGLFLIAKNTRSTTRWIRAVRRPARRAGLRHSHLRPWSRSSF